MTASAACAGRCHRLPACLAAARQRDADRQRDPQPDVDDEQGVVVEPGVAEAARAIGPHRCSAGRASGCEMRADVARARRASRSASAGRCRSVAPRLHLPAVEQPQQPGEQRRQHQHPADQAVREAAVHRQRRPRRPSRRRRRCRACWRRGSARRAPCGCCVLSPVWPSAQPVSEWVKLSIEWPSLAARHRSG